MKKKLLKILLFMITFVFCIILLKTEIFADSGSALVGKFDGNNEQKIIPGRDLVRNAIGPVLNIVRIVAIGIAVIMITYLGIKYVSAAPAEKAEIKNKLIALTVGVALITIASVIVDMAKTATDAIVTY